MNNSLRLAKAKARLARALEDLGQSVATYQARAEEVSAEIKALLKR